MTDRRLLSRAGELRHGRTPFVLATVVRAERPTSARPGDTALLLADGTLEGFVGGTCAESTTRLEGLRMLAGGESGLLRITPGGASAGPRPDGVRTVDNPCLSGSTLEIFLESVLPAPLVGVQGDGPVARSLARVGEALEYDVVVLTGAGSVPSDAAGVVVASHGRDETPVLTSALRAGVPYVALVASRTRAASVLAALDVPDDLRSRVHAPAGMAWGARGAPEIALSILAEFAAVLAGGSDAGFGGGAETVRPRPGGAEPSGSARLRVTSVLPLVIER